MRLRQAKAKAETMRRAWIVAAILWVLVFGVAIGQVAARHHAW